MLFPKQKSIGEGADPELAEVFDNFAFDEVWSYGNLEVKTRLMITLAAMIAGGALGIYKVMLEGALNACVTPIEAKEIVYQAVPYTGMAKAYDFIQATNEILERRGISLPLEGQSTTSPETRFEKGLAVQKAIFGERIEKLHKEAPANQVHIQRYLSDNCFGDHITRSGVEIKMREVLTFSMLMSLGGCESQLRAHTQGNLNVGNDKSVLLSVITQLIPYVGYPRALNALSVLNEVIRE